MSWACGAYGCGEGVYRDMLGKTEEMSSVGRPRCRWENNMRMASRRWDVGMWTELGWPRIERFGGRL